MRIGLFQTEAVFFIYILQTFLIISGFYFRYYTDWFLVILYLGFSSTIIVFFTVANRFDFKFERHKYFDKVIKGRLRELKDGGVFIKILNKIFVAWFLFLFLFICFISGETSIFFSGILILITLLVTIITNKKKELLEPVLRISLYLVIPCLIFLSESNPMEFMKEQILLFYNISVGVLGLLAILILRFTRRKKGFKSSPTDFLVFIMVIMIPFIEGAGIQNYNMVFVAVKIIIYLFSYEVLTGELRKEFKNTEYRWFVHGTILTLMVVSVKSFIHFIY
jgi:UDP-GlcNAc:undecaprenyl-phosphate GlcNAc-1-phosphate transferase